MNNSVDRRKIIRHNTKSSSSTLARENGETIPIDLIIEILSRLPARSIAICRCVSKQWASLLGSQDFTESFLTHSSSRPRILITISFGSKWYFFSSPQPQNLDKDLTLVADYHMAISGFSYGSSLSVNGLIYRLFIPDSERKKERVPVICNTSTGQHLTLPKVRARNIDLRSFIGYDPINKQYKVLCMTVTNYRKQVNSKEHQVLTIGKGKLSWRKIECLFPHYPQQRSDGICIKGVLYYIARSNVKTSLIACFDVRSEKFSFMETLELTYISALINYKGKLGALKYVYDFSHGGGSHGELWVLDDTEKEKWSNHTFVLPLPNIVSVRIESTWATDTGEIFWVPRRWENRFYVFYYNLERKSVRRIEIKGFDEKVGPNDYAADFTATDHVENVMLL